MPKRSATVQIDLDGLWTYQKFLGKTYDITDDILYERGLPKFVELFNKHDIKATFFVVAKDVDVSWKKDLLRLLVKSGHEISNHGLNHDYGFRLDYDQKERDVAESTEKLYSVAGKNIYGFRAPAYNIDRETIEILEKNGYLYDSSVLPSRFVPILKVIQHFIFKYRDTGYSYPIWSSFGVPLRPYRPSANNIFRRGNRPIVELPISVFPLLSAPIHFTYINLMGRPYFKSAFKVLGMMNSNPNFLFHLVDLVDAKTVPDIAGFPILRSAFEKRWELAEYVLKRLKREYRLVTSERLCKEYIESEG